MQLSINIEDNHLQEQITQYISNKHKQTNELIEEALKYFFQNRQKELFTYKTQNPYSFPRSTWECISKP